MREWRSGLGIMLLSSLMTGAVAQQTDAVQRAGKRFRIEFHPGDINGTLSGPLADQALAAVEAAWPTFKRVLGAHDSKPGTIVLYREEKEYLAAECTRWPFRISGFVAKDGSGHVQLHPNVTVPVLARVGLPPNVREDLLRVAAEMVARQVLADSDAIDEDDWMCWILTMGALEAVTNGKGEFGADAGYDLRRSLMKGYVAEHGPLTLESLQNTDLKPTNADDWQWMLTFAALTAQAFGDATPSWSRKLVAKPKLPRAGAADKFWRRATAMEAIFGDLTKADVRFAKTQQALAPRWEQRAGSWARTGDRMLLVASEEASAIALQPPPAGDYSITARVEFGPAPCDVRVLLTGGKVALTVVLSPDYAALSAYDTAKRAWHARATHRPKTAWSAPINVRVEVTAELVRVVIDGVQRLECKHGDHDGDRVFGFEMSHGAVWIDQLRIEPLPAVGNK